jgi:hypothetical protein
MYVSFDDGDHWQSLMLNLPVTSFRDLAIHGNDLIVGTYGRGIWVLDDYAVLRQLTPQLSSEPVHLFKPDDAVRVRRNVNADTPFPPEVPHALNPPEGTIIYYSLSSAAASPITLDVLDAAGKVIRHMSSTPAAPVPEASHPPEPSFWLAPPSAMSARAGLNRVNWDLRYDAPPAFSHSYEINANPGLTPPSPEGPLAAPGVYTIKLTVSGKSYSQSVTVHNDPRSTASVADLHAQQALLVRLDDGLRDSWEAYQQVTALRRAVDAAASNAPAEVGAAVTSYDAKLDSIAGSPGGRGGFRRGGREAAPTFVSVNGELVGQLNAQDNGDMAPTAGMLAAYAAACRDLLATTTAWRRATSTDLSTLNTVFSRNGLQPITAPKSLLAAPSC